MGTAPANHHRVPPLPRQMPKDYDLNGLPALAPWRARGENMDKAILVLPVLALVGTLELPARQAKAQGALRI